MAATEAQRKDYDDALLCNGDGYVGECSSANIFPGKRSHNIYSLYNFWYFTRHSARRIVKGVIQSVFLFNVQEGLFYIESLKRRCCFFNCYSSREYNLVQFSDAIQFSKDLDILDRVNKIYQSTIL